MVREKQKNRDVKLQLQPVYKLLMNIMLKTNIYVNQLLLAADLILNGGSIFQTWLP